MLFSLGDGPYSYPVDNYTNSSLFFQNCFAGTVGITLSSVLPGDYVLSYTQEVLVYPGSIEYILLSMKPVLVTNSGS